MIDGYGGRLAGWPAGRFSAVDCALPNHTNGKSRKYSIFHPPQYWLALTDGGTSLLEIRS
jgi:hypothetical protein